MRALPIWWPLDLGEVGPVGQDLEHGELGGPGQAPQQLCAGGQVGAPQLEGEEPAVGQHQHLVGERPGQRGSEFAFAVPDRADLRVENGVGAALAQRDDLRLGEGAAGSADSLGVGGEVRVGVGQVDHDPVDGHQPPRAQPRPRRAGSGQGRGQAREESAHGGLAQPLAGLAQRADGGDLPLPGPRPGEPQPVHQVTDHLFVSVAEQRQRHHEIHHEMGRQRSRAFFSTVGLGQHLIDDVTRDRSRQHADPHMVRQSVDRPFPTCTHRHKQILLTRPRPIAEAGRRHAALFIGICFGPDVPCRQRRQRRDPAPNRTTPRMHPPPPTS